MIDRFRRRRTRHDPDLPRFEHQAVAAPTRSDEAGLRQQQWQLPRHRFDVAGEPLLDLVAQRLEPVGNVVLASRGVAQAQLLRDVVGISMTVFVATSAVS